ncbi:MAG: hypothetical protein DWI58_08615 [Chloroflexi bacterium]|nr:MAG: hypothetical protein DWI58_08615 [Chloroflexota bacterium]
MIDRLKTGWFPFAAVGLLLFGSLLLDSGAMAIIALFLLSTGLAFTPRDRIRGGTAALLGAVVALGIATLIRLTR